MNFFMIYGKFGKFVIANPENEKYHKIYNKQD